MSRIPEWQPGLEDCQRILQAAFPGLVVDSIDHLGEGWDSVAFLVNGALVFRIPKRASVEWMLRRERRLLAEIADRLPVSVPRCTHVATNLPGFPASLGGYPRIIGWTLDTLSELDMQVDQLAEQITEFLGDLHSIDVCGLPDGIIEPLTHESWWQDRQNLYDQCVPVIENGFPPAVARAVQGSWEQAFGEAKLASFSPVLVHGDLAAEHIIVDDLGTLAGVIDFGDAGLGDPAIDLAGLPEALAASVINNYASGHVERDQLDTRRRLYRLTVPFHAINAGLEWGRPDLMASGIAGIRQRFAAVM